MKLLLMLLTMFFLCLVTGEEIKHNLGNVQDPTEVVDHNTQVSVGTVGLAVSPNWLRSYFFIFNLFEPVKQLDFSSDHDKSWYNLHTKLLRFAQNTDLLAKQQVCHVQKYWRLLAARYINGFYIYSLEKLLD